MRYAVPIEKDSKQTRISNVFARAPKFAIIENESEYVEFLENPFFEEEHGVGKSVCDFLCTIKSVDVFVGYEIGLKLKNATDKYNVQLIIISRKIENIKQLQKIINN